MHSVYICVARYGKALGYTRSGGHAFEFCHRTYTLCFAGYSTQINLIYFRGCSPLYLINIAHSTKYYKTNNENNSDIHFYIINDNCIDTLIYNIVVIIKCINMSLV